MNASVYIACREIGISRKLKDIATIRNVKYKFLTRTYRQLVFELDYKIPVVDLTKCIAKVANKTNLSEKTKRKAIDIMNDIAPKNEIFFRRKRSYGTCSNNTLHIMHGDR
ncbi:MAG TPA: hypothetical protein VFI70_05655 [Nitrososphaeraceae archaeon]|nr:hypothetical protein [Nitrososphaeraceae archaeon]